MVTKFDREYLGLTSLIKEVQLTLPDWLTLTVSSTEYSTGEHFHIKLNEIYIPIDYFKPADKVNDLIDHLHNFVRYENGSVYFPVAKAFSVKDYFKLDPFVLHDILNNLADTPAAIFISKREWYVDVLNSGFFYPLKNVPAAEFLDYINGVWTDEQQI